MTRIQPRSQAQPELSVSESVLALCPRTDVTDDGGGCVDLWVFKRIKSLRVSHESRAPEAGGNAE